MSRCRIGLPFFIERYQGPVDGVLAFTVRRCTVEHKDVSERSNTTLQPRNTNLLVTVAICGSLFASPVAPYLANRFGRKRTIQIAFGLCCLPSSIMQRLALVGVGLSFCLQHSLNLLCRPNLGAMAFARAWNFMGITLAEQV